MSQPLLAAVAQQKGGVGKTTTAVNVAGALADAGHIPLLVDLDPQGFATEATDVEGWYTADGVSLYEALLNRSGPSLNELAVEAPEFPVVPAHEQMDTEDIDAQLGEDQDGRDAIPALVAQSDLEGVDIVLFDCPPKLGALTDGALIAGDVIIIVTQPRHTAKRSLSLLARQIELLQTDHGADAPVAGIVANEAHPDGVSEDLMAWLEDEFGDVPVWEVRKRVALDRAYGAGRSIFAHDESSDMEAVYSEIADHLISLRPQEAADA